MIFHYFLLFLEKIRLDLSCELSAKHDKPYFTEKYEKIIQSVSAVAVITALRVKAI